MRRDGPLYTICFSVLVCGICSVLVSSSAVGLRERQRINQILDRQLKVLSVAGLVQPGERLKRADIEGRFRERIRPKIITLETGSYDDSADPEAFDQRRAANDPATSRPAPENNARLLRLPKQALVYLVIDNDAVEKIVLPVEGKGLWSTLYGFLALDKDTTTIRGLTFYEHAETPGLGGEVDNPRWKALWEGRKAFDAEWNPRIEVIKGQAGAPEADPHHVDGLSGATLTSRGVSYLMQFWLGDDGFGPYLKRFREQGA